MANLITETPHNGLGLQFSDATDLHEIRMGTFPTRMPTAGMIACGVEWCYFQ